MFTDVGKIYTYIPGRGLWWSHVRTLSRGQSSGELLCGWTCGPVSPGPEGHRERRGTCEMYTRQTSKGQVKCGTTTKRQLKMELRTKDLVQFAHGTILNGEQIVMCSVIHDRVLKEVWG